MNLVLCMAGLYKRFREAGYVQPKYLLPWAGRPVLEHVLAPFVRSGCFEQVLLVANRRDEPHRSAITAVLRRQGLEAEALLFIGDTRGQAETALVAAEWLAARPGRRSDKVLFHNIDTVLLGRDFAGMARALDHHDGLIDVFLAGSPAYSYVAVDYAGLVTRIAEKEVISPYATTGLYGFQSLARYQELARTATSGREFYISDVYRQLLACGGRIAMTRPTDAGQTLVLGTPEEYEGILRHSA